MYSQPANSPKLLVFYSFTVSVQSKTFIGVHSPLGNDANYQNNAFTFCELSKAPHTPLRNYLKRQTTRFFMFKLI